MAHPLPPNGLDFGAAILLLSCILPVWIRPEAALAAEGMGGGSICPAVAKGACQAHISPYISINQACQFCGTLGISAQISADKGLIHNKKGCPNKGQRERFSCDESLSCFLNTMRIRLLMDINT